MKIELCEDNGCFTADGVPTLVILQITKDSGSVVRVPYQADRKIQELYADIGRMVEKAPHSRDVIMKSEVTSPEFLDAAKKYISEIEREDIVKCVKLQDRNPGADCDLVVGNEYRVIEIIKTNKIISFYEVLDDKSDNKFRIPVFPNEIELVRKHVPPPPRKQVFEITKRCDQCGEINSLELNGAQYECVCLKCKKFIVEKRKLAV